MSKKSIPVEEPGAAPQDAATVDTGDTGYVPGDVIDITLTGAEVLEPVLIQEPTGHLPDAANVDPAKIKTNTLTKQGWVLPTAAQVQAAG